jgi:hypothetical protein
VGRAYAGIMGPLAFAAVLLRGLGRGWPMESTLLSAWLALVTMAAVGLVAGRLAKGIVDESVRGRMMDEMAAREAARQTSAKTAGG